MSGGVDSSIAAALLQEAGHEVVGMTMRLYDASEDERRGRGGTCCSPAEIDAARDVCDRLGIPHYTVDERERFTATVIDPFARDYATGLTPNPCTRCNQHVKFTPLLARARALGADAMATGHYARLQDGRLLRGVDPDKDQSYFLFAMGREAASRTRMPLGEWTKDAVRRKAAALGLPNAAAPDSVELCFVPGGDHGAVVERRLRALGLATDALAPGPVVDTGGEQVGEHDGIHRVTVGQRRGLRVRGHDRRYALRVVPQTRTVVVGEPHEAEVAEIEIGEPTWLRTPGDAPVRVQLRHRAPAVPARIAIEDGRVRVRFDAPVRAVAPGQAAVVYDGDEVLGGGWIAPST
jgi:tRNA-specific 2-thiouridylase